MHWKERQDWLKERYPLTVVMDRYNGTYSGAKFLAFPLDFSEVPIEVGGSDTECAYFWKNYEEPVGKGASAKEAIDDLIAKIKGTDENALDELLDFLRSKYVRAIIDDEMAKTWINSIERRKSWSEEDERMWEGTLNSLKKYQLISPNFQVELQMKWLKKEKEKQL